MDFGKQKFVKFISKTNTGKLTEVDQRGVYLTSRTFLNYNIDLFHLDDFFVEVWRSNRTQAVLIVQGCRETECLENYLGFIDVSDAVVLID